MKYPGHSQLAALVSVAVSFGLPVDQLLPKIRILPRVKCPECGREDTYTKNYPKCKCNWCGNRWKVAVTGRISEER